MKALVLILSLSLLFAFSNNTLVAQDNTNIKFDKKLHNFGRIKEEGGRVLYKFKFKNIGKKPVIVTRVESSCGCTTPDWTRSPILPNKEGFVGAEFDPNGRPGVFNKHVKVYTNISKEPIKLVIKGDVVHKEKSIADIYKYQVGALRMKSRYLAFARMYNTEKKTLTVPIINDSDKPIKVEFMVSRMPKHIKAEVVPSTLNPKQNGQFVITFDATKQNDWGHTTKRLKLMVDGDLPANNIFTVSATINEDFSKLTKKELKNAPTMVFSEKVFNFGEIKQGDVVKHEFKFKNTGKRDLIIRKTKTSCGCTAVETKKVIAPGESSLIAATFRSRGKRGKQNKRITLITNIPGKDKNGASNNQIVLWVKGNVLVVK